MSCEELVTIVHNVKFVKCQICGSTERLIDALRFINAYLRKPLSKEPRSMLLH